jgi:rSAM/selenodomain-associated transferase 1
VIHVALFAKPPVPGRTKSRLAAGIGGDAAADFSRSALVDNLAVLREAAVEFSVWYPPEADPADFGGLIPDGIEICEQSGCDLGQRMAHAIDHLLAAGADAAFIAGADCITHTSATLADARALAADGSLVLQPAVDGGFVLIGSQRPLAGLLDGLRWGGADALELVLARCEGSEIPYSLMVETFDVDVAADLQKVREWVGEHRRDGFVARWLAEFGA